jgi:hypothetical protein
MRCKHVASLPCRRSETRMINGARARPGQSAQGRQKPKVFLRSMQHTARRACHTQGTRIDSFHWKNWYQPGVCSGTWISCLPVRKFELLTWIVSSATWSHQGLEISEYSTPQHGRAYIVFRRSGAGWHALWPCCTCASQSQQSSSSSLGSSPSSLR